MSRPRSVVLAAAMMAIALVVPLPARTLACSCAGLGRVEAYADVVLVGRVGRVYPPGPGRFGDYRVMFAVEEPIKGVQEPMVFVRSPGGGSSACGVEFAAGERWKIYADRAEGVLHTSLCSGNEPLGMTPARRAGVWGWIAVHALVIGSIGLGWMLFRRRDALMPPT